MGNSFYGRDCSTNTGCTRSWSHVLQSGSRRTLSAGDQQKAAERRSVVCGTVFIVAWITLTNINVLYSAIM
jgi:hypothetical protein